MTARRRKRSAIGWGHESVPQNATEVAVFAAAFATRMHELHVSGYPHAWSVADRDAGRNAKISEWEDWVGDRSIEWARTSVHAMRQALKREKENR